MRQCELLRTKENGQVVAGIFTLDDDGRVTTEAKAGYSILMRDALGEPHIVDGERKVYLSDDAEEWFDSLPEYYNGSYLNARMLGDV